MARKHSGVALGLVLSLLIALPLFAAPALADTKGPYHVTSAQRGWNSITHSMASHWFDMKNCLTDPYDDYLWFESMHHWPFWPSTGIGKQLLACVNNSTYRTLYWSQSETADFSIEYVRMCCYNSATIVHMDYRLRH